MATHRLSIPLGEDDVRSLRIGDNFAREYAKLPDYVLKRIGEIDHSLENEVIVGKPERK